MLEPTLGVKARVRRSRRRRLCVAVLALVATLLSSRARAAGEATPPAPGDDGGPVLDVPTPAGDVTYTPGRGLRLADTGITLGGYSNVNLVRDEGGPALLKLDDLSLFVSWDPTTRLHLFSELEFEDLVQVDDHGNVGNPDYQFTTERLYGDVAVSDAISVRVGKFLTPVGRWNEIHAQPLVWTTSRPLVTEEPFDPHTTGAMLFGTLFPSVGSVSWALYGQATPQFDPVTTPLPAQHSGGARLVYDAPAGWSVGTSYLSAEAHGAWRHLGGLDGLVQRGPVEIMGEAIVQGADRRADAQWGLYVQPVLEVWPHVFLVGRYEHWERAHGPLPNNLFVTGIAYRPRPWLLLKAEYLAADHPAEEEPSGFKSSVAILF